MTPRVIFQHEKWLPGSFFNVKIWHGSNFNIKFWTTSREKVTFSHEILTSRGSFFNDFSTLKISLYTSANEVVEVYWFHHSCCLSVHLSVRLWKSGFYTITPIPFDIQSWYFTYMLTLTWGWPLLIWVKRSKVKFGI